jgi:hypothetical protein
MSVIVSTSGKVRKVDEMRFVPSGSAVLSFEFAKNVGTSDNPVFNNYKATLWGQKAQSLNGKILKDTRFHITGSQKITQREYEGKIYVTAEINVMDFEFAGEAPKQEEKPVEAEEETIAF